MSLTLPLFRQDALDYDLEQADNFYWFNENYEALKKEHGRGFVAVLNNNVFEYSRRKGELISKLKSVFKSKYLDVVYIGKLPDSTTESNRKFDRLMKKDYG